jgi:hypothetical protein
VEARIAEQARRRVEKRGVSKSFTMTNPQDDMGLSNILGVMKEKAEGEIFVHCRYSQQSRESW